MIIRVHPLITGVEIHLHFLSGMNHQVGFCKSTIQQAHPNTGHGGFNCQPQNFFLLVNWDHHLKLKIDFLQVGPIRHEKKVLEPDSLIK